MPGGKLVGGDKEHQAIGTVTLESNTLTLEKIYVAQEPGVQVVLAQNFDFANGLSLGPLQGFTGTQKYTVHGGVEETDFNTVVLVKQPDGLVIARAELV